MDSRVLVQPKVLDAEVHVSRANQAETHFSCMRDAGLEPLAGMAPFQIPPYMTALFPAGTFPQRLVWAWAGRDGCGAPLVPPGRLLFPFLFLKK